MASKPFAGRIAIITGGSRGIGREIALQFARRGMRGITITFRSNTQAAKATLGELCSLGSDAMAIQVEDTVDHDFADSVVQRTLERFAVDGIDILINNAGCAIMSNMGQVTREAFIETFEANVLAPFLMVQSVLPVIFPGGSIINLTSISGRVSLGGPTAMYASSKAALEHLTRNLAVTHAAEKKITINNVAPGATDTDALWAAPKEIVDIVTVANDWTPEKRVGTPGEVADIVCFLCLPSGGSRWINGATIPACGGAAMCPEGIVP